MAGLLRICTLTNGYRQLKMELFEVRQIGNVIHGADKADTDGTAEYRTFADRAE